MTHSSIQSPAHTFHIPVMGLSFTVDTPIKVARFGISSVISIAEDHLIELMRKHYYQSLGLPFQPISKDVENYRAKRICDYLNLVNQIVNNQIDVIKQESFGQGNEIDRYFEMLPSTSHLKSVYQEMNSAINLCEKIKLQDYLRTQIVSGSIDVNIMTKLDKSNPTKSGEILDENSDAIAALRGYAQSNLFQSSIVFSAGMNPRLFNYLEHCEDFSLDAEGNSVKKIIVKVNDYRSALIQGKYLAKKGIWVHEFRIESGLNCGGHAFATDGYLLGPILEEFKAKKKELVDAIYTQFTDTLTRLEKPKPLKINPIKLSVQGGIGTYEEDYFLHQHYHMDSTGWGTPFLLVPEATTVDQETMDLLCKAKQENVILSKSSPLGVRFNYLKGTSAYRERMNRIAVKNPGSPCTEKHLAFNTEFTKEPICTASKKYQKLKLAEIEQSELTTNQKVAQKQEILDKECLCVGLSNSAAINYKEIFLKKLTAVTMCPGPNIANFSQIVSLKTMIDHIYGRISSLTKSSRPHMFIAELNLYMDYFKEMLTEEISVEQMDKRKKYFNTFLSNLNAGIEYYHSVKDLLADSAKQQFLKSLQFAEDELKQLQQKYALHIA